MAMEFDVDSDDIEQAWMLIVAGSLEDGTLLRVSWYPLREGTKLSFEHQMAYTRTRLRPGPFAIWRQRHPHAVGPGKDAVALYSMPRHNLRPLPESLLEVIYSHDEVQLRRSGTSQDGDPKTWLKLPPVPQ